MPLSTRMMSVLGSNEGNKEAWSLGYSFVLTFAYWQIVWPQSSDVLPEEVLKPEGTILDHEAEKKIGLENQPMVQTESPTTAGFRAVSNQRFEQIKKEMNRYVSWHCNN